VEGNEAFGPDFSGKANYDFFIVQCPINCHIEGNAKVFGYEIHP